MNDSRDFKDAESVRSGPSHVPSQPALFPLYRDSGGLLSRNNQPPDIWNLQGKIGKRFLQIHERLLSPHPGDFNPWISDETEDGERQIPDAAKHQLRIRDASPDRQPKIQSFQVREILQRIMGQTNDCRSQIFILTNSLLQQHLLVGR